MGLAQPWISPEDYLNLERGTEAKHEYHDGQMYLMAGASLAHNLIVSNTLISLGNQLKGKPCKVFPGDLKLKVLATGLYTYPDLMVISGKAQFDDTGKEVVTNPSILIEVLSPSTEAYDRGKKFENYRKITTLQDYVLIAQSSCHIEKFTRLHQEWLFNEAAQPHQAVALESIQCQLILSEIYADVEFI